MNIINLQVLAFISVVTTLTTECIKTFMRKAKKPYVSNIIAAVVAVIISAVVCVVYPIIMQGAELSPQLIFTAVVMAFFSVLCATLTFEKVKEALDRLKG